MGQASPRDTGEGTIDQITVVQQIRHIIDTYIELVKVDSDWRSGSGLRVGVRTRLGQDVMMLLDNMVFAQLAAMRIEPEDIITDEFLLDLITTVRDVRGLMAAQAAGGRNQFLAQLDCDERVGAHIIQMYLGSLLVEIEQYPKKHQLEGLIEEVQNELSRLGDDLQHELDRDEVQLLFDMTNRCIPLIRNLQPITWDDLIGQSNGILGWLRYRAEQLLVEDSAEQALTIGIVRYELDRYFAIILQAIKQEAEDNI